MVYSILLYSFHNYYYSRYNSADEDNFTQAMWYDLHSCTLCIFFSRYNSADEDNFTQCGIFYRDVLNEEEKERLVDNIASHLCNAQKFIQVMFIDWKDLQNDFHCKRTVNKLYFLPIFFVLNQLLLFNFYRREQLEILGQLIKNMDKELKKILKGIHFFFLMDNIIQQ